MCRGHKILLFTLSARVDKNRKRKEENERVKRVAKFRIIIFSIHSEKCIFISLSNFRWETERQRDEKQTSSVQNVGAQCMRSFRHRCRHRRPLRTFKSLSRTHFAKMFRPKLRSVETIERQNKYVLSFVCSFLNWLPLLLSLPLAQYIQPNKFLLRILRFLLSFESVPFLFRCKCKYQLRTRYIQMSEQ